MPENPAKNLEITEAPEAFNAEQDDEPAQAQSVADEALGRTSSSFGLSDTEKVASDGDEDARRTWSITCARWNRAELST